MTTAILLLALLARPQPPQASERVLGAPLRRSVSLVSSVGCSSAGGGGSLRDVEAAAVDRAGALSPVRGGVGPLTVTMLMANMIEAARLARGSAH